MVKTYSPQNIAAIDNIRFGTDEQGALTRIEVTCEVNYGEFGRSEVVDLLPLLTLAQQTAAQGFYANLKTKLVAVLL